MLVSVLKRSFQWKSALVVMAIAGLLAMPNRAEANDPPVLLDFTFINPIGDYFVFFGTVDDEDLWACTTLFGGMLQGYYSSVDEDGSFYLVLELYPNDYGPVAAQAVDPWGAVSNILMTWASD